MADDQRLPSAIFETEVPAAMSFNELHLVVVHHRHFTIPEVLRRLAKDAMGVDSVDANGRTPLWWAAWRSDKAMIQKLVDVAADPDRPDKDQVTPVHLCARANGIEPMRTILECKPGPDLTLLDKHGRSAVHYTCEQTWSDSTVSMDMLELVARHGCDILAADLYGRTGLHRCVVTDNLPAARWLLEQGCDVDGLDKWGKSALIDAIVHNRHDMLALLLARSVNVTQRYGPDRESSLLHFAGRYADGKTLRLLLDVQELEGLDSSAVDGEGRNADELFRAREPQADADAREQWVMMLIWLAEDGFSGSEKSWIYEDALESQIVAVQCRDRGAALNR